MSKTHHAKTFAHYEFFDYPGERVQYQILKETKGVEIVRVTPYHDERNMTHFAVEYTEEASNE